MLGDLYSGVNSKDRCPSQIFVRIDTIAFQAFPVERHLKRILRGYFDYHNTDRTHVLCDLVILQLETVG